MSHESTTPDWRPSRRTVVKGAAWAAPVIAVASAAPASAAASGPVVPSYRPGTFCKHPSDNAYHAVFCFNNTSDVSITVTFTNFTVSGVSAPGGIVPASVTVPAETETCYYVDGMDFPNAQNDEDAILSFSYQYGAQTVTGSVTATLPTQGLTPCGTNPVEAQPKDEPPHDPVSPPN